MESMEGIKINFPKGEELDQDEEWFEVEKGGKSSRMRIHDYREFFKQPGLYETVMVDHLKCESPRVVCDVLNEEMDPWLEQQDTVNALDLGAGNGMVAEQLKKDVDCETIVGVDIIPEAKAAAQRDRPGLYDHYYVADLTTKEGVGQLQDLDADFNLMVTVAALGYGDIPVKAFLNAFNLLDDGSLVAFNIKDRFLSDADHTGYSDAIQGMCQGSMDVLQTRKYRHRVSVSGDPLYYVAIVGQKVMPADPNVCLAGLG